MAMGMKGGWFRRRPSDDEMREELEAHVAMRAEHDGVDEAAAQRRLGNALQTREAMRRVWIAQWWDALRQDAWFTWRSWRRQPGFALGAILVLALGLGASTALFAALDRVLFRPLPYADPDRLVSIGLVSAPPGGSFDAQTESMVDRFYVQVWDRTPAPFHSVTTMGIRPCQIAETEPEGLQCAPVEHNFLRVLGVRVALGRDFAPQDDGRGAPWVALISHALWVRRYGADPGVVERSLNLETAWGPLPNVRIVGVLPRGFEMPLDTADILFPSQLRPLDPTNRIMQSITVLGRLRPDATPEGAGLALAPPQIASGAPATFRTAWRVRPLHDRRVGDAARVAWLLIGAVATFLLIACVNVANLMLARVAERQREFAVRAAVGAGRTRLARLALAESLLLALTAGALGLLLAFALLQTFVAMAPPRIPGVAQASIDLRVFAVAVLLAAFTGVAIGLWPTISVFRAGAVQGLRPTGLSSPSTRPGVRFGLVSAQIALTLALLGGSALLLRSLWNVVTLPLGFDAVRVITLTTTLGRARYPTPEHSTAYFEELLVRVRAMPGTVSAALSDAEPPPRPGLGRAPIGAEGRPLDPGVPLPGIGIRQVTPQYFETFRIPLVRGRTLQEADRHGEPAAVINESAARVLFPTGPAIGRRIRSGPDGSWFTVVGVTADVRNGRRITDPPVPEIYMVARAPWGQIGRLSLRTTASPADAHVFLRQIAADIDPRQLVTIQTADELLATLTAQPRFITSLLTAFAALALLLAGAGLYSVASYLVAQRRRDIGVRVALGASPSDVARQVVGEAGRWIVAGALLGCALGWMGTRALRSQLYDVQALDPGSWAAAVLVLALVLIAAVFRPARRAAHVDPIAALRAE
jgi:predicted permease